MQDLFQVLTQRHSISVLALIVVSDIHNGIVGIWTRVHWTGADLHLGAQRRADSDT